MIELAYGYNEEVAQWVAAHIPGCERGFANPVGIGVVDGEELIAGVVYHNWNPDAAVIEMSAAAISPKWLAPKVLHRIFSYPFDELAIQMVVLRVSERNERMRRIAERFGFIGYLIPRLRGRDENEYIFCLTREAWDSTRFKRSGHGQTQGA